MRNFGLICIAAISLAGCSTLSVIEGTTVSPQVALVAANSFDAFETSVAAYDQLPLCGASAPVTCHTMAAVVAADKAVRAGRAARNAVEAVLTANNGAPIPVASYNTLAAAITTLDAVYTQYNIPLPSSTK